MSDLYIVLIVCLISWVGVFSYIFRFEMKLKKLEKRYEE